MYLKNIIDSNEVTDIFDSYAMNDPKVVGWCMGDLVDIGYASIRYVYRQGEKGIIWTYSGPNKIRVGGKIYSRGDVFGDTYLLVNDLDD